MLWSRGLGVAGTRGCESSTPGSSDADGLIAGLNAVGYDLFGVAATEGDEDVVLSPLSIGLAFGMADVGATGATAEALADLFAYPIEGQARWSAFARLDGSEVTVPLMHELELSGPAAAATALGFQESGPPEPDITVRADRPFLYLIRHKPTGRSSLSAAWTPPPDFYAQHAKVGVVVAR